MGSPISSSTVRGGKHFSLRPYIPLLMLHFHEEHLGTKAQTLCKGSLEPKMNMDAIKSIYTPRMGCEALNMVEKRKQAPWDIAESS